MDVAKVNRDVINVSYVFSDVYCKCVYLDVAYVSHICFKCFHMFQKHTSSVSFVFFCMLQALYLNVSKVDRRSATNIHQVGVDQIFSGAFATPRRLVAVADHAPTAAVSSCLRQLSDGCLQTMRAPPTRMKWRANRTTCADVRTSER